MATRRVKHPAGRPASAPAALLLALSAIASIADRASAQVPPGGGGTPAIDQQMVNDRPEFLVRAWVDKKYQIYAEGETLTLKVRCEQDAYLYILYQQADGKVFQIFPNKGQPDNRVKAMQDVQVPDPDDGFRWVVEAPFGPEIVKVVASKKPIDALSLPGLREDHFNPVSLVQLEGAGQQVGKEPANAWSEHDLKILTVRKGEPTEPPGAPKRIGVFFGVADYEFNEEYMQLQRDAMKRAGKVDESQVKPLSLRCPANDAPDMAEKLKKLGQLSEARVFINREATREKMREMITEWLPSASKPGDTVFIFFSGHGTQIPDDDNDEKDKLDEVLSPYDTMSPGILFLLLDRDKAGRLEPSLSQRVVRWFKTLKDYATRIIVQLGGNPTPEILKKANDKADLYLIQQTSVTDDEMGHWVQKLDGRRVVVIMDACRSGGMSRADGAPDKGLDRSPRAGKGKGFDFLSGEFARLKDLNQPTLTVLAAASETQDSIEFTRARNGLFTAALMALLDTANGPVDARTAVDVAAAVIKNVIADFDKAIDQVIQAHPEKKEELEKQKGSYFTPTLFTTDPNPVYLKPPVGGYDANSAPKED